MSDTKQDTNTSTTDLGEAHALTMDAFVRTLIGQMFDNDNDTATLKASLQGVGDTPPEVELEIRLISINGQNVRS
jgi:hypothetical protein